MEAGVAAARVAGAVAWASELPRATGRRTTQREATGAVRAKAAAVARDKPRAEEAAVGAQFLKEHTLTDFTHVLLNLNEFLYVR